MTKSIFYNREKKIKIPFENITHDFLLIALSAKEKEQMMAEAQKSHANAVELLTEAAESIRKAYLLQGVEVLTEAILLNEHEKFVAQATFAHQEGRETGKELTNEVEMMTKARRAALLNMTKEQLAEQLVALEMVRQVHNAWTYSVLEATLARTLHDENRQRFFSSVDEMKSSVSDEVLPILYEELIDFLEECGNAQVFLKPHAFRG